MIEALCYRMEGRGLDSRWDCIFSIYLYLPVTVQPWVRLSLSQKWVPRNFLGGKGRPLRKADNLTATCVTPYVLCLTIIIEIKGGNLCISKIQINLQRPRTVLRPITEWKMSSAVDLLLDFQSFQIYVYILGSFRFYDERLGKLNNC
jgi:hypothetical protein